MFKCRTFEEISTHIHKWQTGSLIFGVLNFLYSTVPIAFSLFSRRRPRTARYYQVFGREPEYSWWMLLIQCLYGGLRCVIFYGLLFLIIKWYIWPTVAPNLMKYIFVKKALNHSSSLLERLKSNRKLPFE